MSPLLLEIWTMLAPKEPIGNSKSMRTSRLNAVTLTQEHKKTIGDLERILLYLRDTLTRKPKVGSVCGPLN